MKDSSTTRRIELNDETAELLSRVARELGVSEDEVIRRVLIEITDENDTSVVPNRLEVLEKLQRKLELTPAQADAWYSAIRDARR